MAKLNVMLCCGAGLSSGFLAQRVRAEAKKQKLDLQIEARSESQVDATDILLLGPHFSSQLPNYQDLAKIHHFKVDVIPQKIYGTLDAVGMLKLIQKIEEDAQ